MFPPDPVMGPDPVSQMTEFRSFCEGALHRSIPAPSFEDFCIVDHGLFWGCLFRWLAIPHGGSPDPACTDGSCERAAFFPRVEMNYAEALLGTRPDADDATTAITAIGPTGAATRMTRGDLRRTVIRLARELSRLGIGPGDRVVAIARNDANAVIAALASAAVGAAFSSASPDMGSHAILDRFRQLSPSLLMANLSPASGGDPERDARRLDEVVRGLPTVTGMVALDDGPVPPAFRGCAIRLSALSSDPTPDTEGFAWTRFPFNQPLFIMFSSGTTGLPKCIVHGAGGTLIEHLKEHRLHGDLRPHDTLFFQTSTTWMMWNWQLSALACRAGIVLFDGPVSGPESIWDIVAGEGVTVFGTSPAFIRLCECAGYSPRHRHSLPALRAMMSTGSVLHDRQFDWVGQHVGPIPLQSISGGTDIIGCFVLGHPDLPVRRGESQARSLGMDVRAYRSGVEVPAGEEGELVCLNPFPSRPLGFHGDADGSRFHEAYFSQNPGAWTHGDLIRFSEAGGVRMLGRSDSTINVNGIRIGPGEIYRILQGITGIREAMAVEQRSPGDAEASRIVLMVVPDIPGTVDDAFQRELRKAIASQATSAHVPGLIVEVTALPSTHSGKRSEAAARDALNGKAGANLSAIANPDCLDEILARVSAADRASQAADLSGTSLYEALALIWKDCLNVGDIRPDDDFFELGGTSLMAVQMSARLSEHIGANVGPWMVLKNPTLRRMGIALAAAETSPSLIVPLKPSGTGRPVFLLPGMFGDVMELRGLAGRLRTDRPVLGIRALGLGVGERPHTRVGDMAEDIIGQIRGVQPSGPYCLAGYSFGGVVSFEIACRLRRAGEEVEFLGIIDSNLSEALMEWPERFSFWTSRLAHYALAAARRPPGRTLGQFWYYLTSDLLKLRPRRRLGVDMPPLLDNIARTNERMVSSYRPGPYEGRITFFRASDPWRRVCDPVPLWRRVCAGPLDVCRVEGGHLGMVTEPHVASLAQKLSAYIGDATREPA